MNERVLTGGEEDQGEVVLGGQYGGGVVEDAVGVPSLHAGPTEIVLFSSSKNFSSAHGLIPF